MKSNIVLIGYRGSGKTTVGMLLAKSLSYTFIDTDEFIENREQKKISEIVKEKNWNYFRRLENEAVRIVGKLTNHIISTGGGIIINKNNIDVLKTNGWLVYLSVTPETVAERIKDDTNRPSLTGTKSFLEEIEEVLDKRKKLYEKYSDFKIETDEIEPLTICEKIITAFRNFNKQK